MSNNRLRGTLAAWLPVLLGIGVLCVESTPQLGADRTSGPLQYLYTLLFGPAKDWAAVHHLLRKGGHFVGYGTISLFIYRGTSLTIARFAPVRVWLRQLYAHLSALVGTFLLASLDEWHQSFLPNRGSSFQDVMLDCSGAAAMQLAAWCIIHL